MKPKFRIMLLVAGMFVLAALAYWVRLLVAAHYSSTRNIGSTSQIIAFSSLLSGSACVVGFIAGAVSFWRHPASALILRVVIALFSAVGMFMVARGLIGLLITPRSFSVASLRPVPVTSGLILLCAYFAASLATALPFIPIRLLFRVGLILHYGVFPASLAFIVLLGMPSDYYTPFSSFGIYLVAGSAFALLSFRMYELRQTFDRDA